MYFPDGDNAWLVVGSAGGAAAHPAWIYNLAKHPDQVWIQIDRGSCTSPRVPDKRSPVQSLAAHHQPVPSFAGYEIKTDRELPVVRLTPA